MPSGEIVSLGQELQFEGNGRYTVSVSVLAGDRGDCLTAGETATGSFDVAAMLTPTVTGELVLRSHVAGRRTPRVTAPEPRGGTPGVQCTLGPTVIPAPGQSAFNLPEEVVPAAGRVGVPGARGRRGQDLDSHSAELLRRLVGAGARRRSARTSPASARRWSGRAARARSGSRSPPSSRPRRPAAPRR